MNQKKKEAPRLMSSRKCKFKQHDIPLNTYQNGQNQTLMIPNAGVFMEQQKYCLLVQIENATVIF